MIEETSQKQSLRFFLCAAEPSGDVLGEAVIETLNAIAAETGRPMEVVGVGGRGMTARGQSSLFPMEEITAFGLAEVLPRIPAILARLDETAAAVERLKPDAVLTIDAPDFSFRLAKRIRRLGMPMAHLVAPTVWAWRPGRAKKIAPLYDHLFCLFPFEPPYFEKVGLSASFTGHPLTRAGIDDAGPLPFLNWAGVGDEAQVITFLPGSRDSELNRLLPVFEAVAGLLARDGREATLSMPTLPRLRERLETVTAQWKLPVIVHDAPALKYPSFRASRAALAASGTVSLELALARLPSVITYKVSPLSAWIFRCMKTTAYVALPNIIAGEEVMPELLQEACTPERIAKALAVLLDDPNRANAQIKALDRVATTLGEGAGEPALTIARTLWSLALRAEGARPTTEG